MSNKSQLAYEHAFNFFEKNVFKLSEAGSFTTDYELAMRAALKKINPDEQMVACYFHFAQACKKRAAQLGLQGPISSNSNMQSIYYRLLSLPLLPAKYILPAFTKIQSEARKIKCRNFRSFLAYYNRQWIVKVSNAHTFTDIQSDTQTNKDRYKNTQS